MQIMGTWSNDGMMIRREALKKLGENLLWHNSVHHKSRMKPPGIEFRVVVSPSTSSSYSSIFRLQHHVVL
jgi:hypothetical protein